MTGALDRAIPDELDADRGGAALAVGIGAAAASGAGS
jgi:hypothetical protein